MTRTMAAVSATLLLFGGWLAGQEKTEPAPRGRGSLPAHWSRLGLNDEQKEKILSVRSSYRARIDDLEKQVRALRKKEKAEMEDVLTDAQKSRLREILTERAPRETTKPAKETPATTPSEAKPTETKPGVEKKSS